MAAVHTDGPAIFGNYLVNEAEQKIQYVKLRPSEPFDSKTPVTFLIPSNTAQYTSLRDSMLYIECHVEETDRYGQPLEENDQSASKKRKRRAEPSGGDSETQPDKRQAEPSGSDSETQSDNVRNKERMKTTREIGEMLDEAQEKWNASQDAEKKAEEAQYKDPENYERLKSLAEGLEDMAFLSMKRYLEAKEAHSYVNTLDGAIVPLDNVMHSMWNGIDIFMNGEMVSTTNQKYMYKAYIETILNNSATTKKYQLENTGYYGDGGNKDMFFGLTNNKGMERRYMSFRNKNKVEMMGFLLSDMMGIQAAIVNGVEITITLKPNLDIVRLQCFGDKQYGALKIDNIRLYLCKKQMTKEVMLAHADIMQTNDATYPFKKSEIRAYTGNKGQTEIVIENPYESKVPTRFIVGMIDAEAYIGHRKKNALNFQHYNISRASFTIDDQPIAKPPYTLDPHNGKFIEPLVELHSILGKAGEDMDIGITPDDYLNGLFLIPFDVTPTAAANMEYLSIKECGNCRLELQFKESLPHNIVVLTYAIFPMELHIDGARNCRVCPV